jgi:hypothetical protein
LFQCRPCGTPRLHHRCQCLQLRALPVHPPPSVHPLSAPAHLSSTVNKPFHLHLRISTRQKTWSPYPFPYLLHLHPCETFQVFDQTSRAHFSPYTGVFNGTTLFNNEPRPNFFIQFGLLLFNPKSSSHDIIPLV